MREEDKRLIQSLLGAEQIPLLFVMRKACAECLFTDNRLVSKTRADQIVTQCREKNSHFICHKATLAGDKNVVCRAYYNRVGDDVLEIRLVHKFGIVFYVDEEDFQCLPPREQGEGDGE